MDLSLPEFLSVYICKVRRTWRSPTLQLQLSWIWRSIMLFSPQRCILSPILCRLGLLVLCLPGGQPLCSCGWTCVLGHSGSHLCSCGHEGPYYTCWLLLLVAVLALGPGVLSIRWLPANQWTLPLTWHWVLIAPPLLQRTFGVQHW